LEANIGSIFRSVQPIIARIGFLPDLVSKGD
jgi:hypothetical protein